jgi:hypothetical protein
MRLFCQKTKTAYSYSMKKEYKSAGTWPEGGVDITEEDWIEMVEISSKGQHTISSDSQGNPVLTAINQGT